MAVELTASKPPVEPLQGAETRPARAPRSADAHSRSFAKAVSWRITGSLDTFLLSLIITGSIKIAGAIAIVEVITKIALFYLHERAWGLVQWGRR